MPDQGASDAGADGAEMTIDELARSVDLPVSTLRMYQHRGLLAPPVRRGRVGWYGPAHRERLGLIARLQDRGFSLAAIRELVEGAERGESLRAVLGLGEGPSTWTAEEPEVVALDDLATSFPEMGTSPEMVRRVLDLGLVTLAEEPGRVVVHSPAFLRIGRELAALDVPAGVILDQYEALRSETGVIAERFTDVFRTVLWEPFVAAGAPADRAVDLVGRLEMLGPLAEGVVVTALRQALQERAEAFIQAQAAELGIPLPRPGSG